ncbi:MAG: DUF1631 family protein [Thermomonas sp.]|uniref:DUF1631 family protein n=1 Tax=Thermomonas sp. TaxID=1971895 RepID=UPI0039E27F70
MAAVASTTNDLPTLAQATLPRRVQKVLERLLADLDGDFSRRLPQLLKDTEQALSELPASPHESRMEISRFVSMRNLLQGIPAFSTRFMAEMEAGLASLRDAGKEDEDEPAPKITAHKLSLADEGSIGDHAQLANLASRIESRNSLSLQLMSQRFGVLAGSPALEGRDLPLGPHALCRALASAMDTLEVSQQARSELLRQFEKMLMTAYPAILDALNVTLVQEGILPHLSFVPYRLRQPSAHVAPGQGTPGAATGAAGTPGAVGVPIAGVAGVAGTGTMVAGVPMVGGVAGGVGMPGGVGVGIPGGVGGIGIAGAGGGVGGIGIAGGVGGVGIGGGGGGGAGGGGGVGGIGIGGGDGGAGGIGIAGGVPGAGGGGSADQVVTLVFTMLQQLLRRRGKLLTKLRQPGQGENLPPSLVGKDERKREILDREEVLTTLRRMRSTATRADTIAGYRQILLAQARQLHGRGVALSEADNDIFELLALFLSQLQREMRKPSPGDAMVDHLRLPLLQIALRDQRFFEDARHPARQLLAAVSLAGARWLPEDDLDPQWLGLLQRAVAGIQEDNESNLDSFIEANHALQSGLQALLRKAEMAERRQVDAARGRDKLEIARQRAAAEIKRLHKGRELPRFQKILLEQAWADVLSLTFLRNGEQSDAWQDALDATARIVDASTGNAQKAAYAGFIARLQASLEQVGYHADDALAIARQLANGNAEDAGLASRTELLMQLRARARLGEGNAAGAGASAWRARTQPEQDARDRLVALQDAVWVDLHDEAGKPVRRRLAWVSPHTGQALLVNRRGIRIAGDDLDGLARRLAEGRMQLLDDDTSPAETAWQATTVNLQRTADEAEAPPEQAEAGTQPPAATDAPATQAPAEQQAQQQDQAENGNGD